MLKRSNIVFIVALILVTGVGVALGYALRRPHTASPPVQIEEPSTVEQPAEVSTPAPSPESSPIVEGETITTAMRLTNITWQAPEEVTGYDALFTTSNYGPDIDRDNGVHFYKVGVVQDAPFKGSNLLVAYADMPMGSSIDIHVLRDASGKFTLLDHYYDAQSQSFSSPGLIHAPNVRIPVLDTPQTIQGPKPRQSLVKRNAVWWAQDRLFSLDGLTLVFRDATWGNIYTDSNSRQGSNGFYFRLPDGTRAVYAWEKDVGDKNGNTFTWNNGKKEVIYNLAYVGGCGAGNFINATQSITVQALTSKEFKVVGRTRMGDSLYTYARADVPILREFYETRYYAPQGTEKMSYEAFLATYPLLYFIDPFGRVIEMTSTEFQTPAECGKPVIYLYPEKTTDVSVKLAPQGGFSASEPTYNRGWNVIAQPNGTLTEKATGKIYPYLFWEGRGGLYQAPKQGSVVAQKDVHGHLVSSLSTLGLNQNEIADFLTFWEPRMQSAPYYFITFLGNHAMDQIAPLTVTPKPDTVIRVLMDFLPLEKPIETAPLTLKQGVRKGFTVIEWGGVLR